MKHYGFKWILLFLIFLSSLNSYTQDITEDIKIEKTDTILKTAKKATNPVKASLYSAIIPGLGQIYNKKYWKAPIVWGALGGGIAFISYYNNNYKRYRSAFLSSIRGETHEFSTLTVATSEWLARKQDDARRDRDYAIAITTLLYVLNIIDATVDAHLSEFKVDKDLSFQPVMIDHDFSDNMSYGLSFKLEF